MGLAFMEISLLGLKERIFPEMTLTFNTFISSVNCQRTNFRSQASIVSEKSTVSYFSIEKPKEPILTLALKVRVNPGSSFEQTMMSWSPRCYIPSFVEIGPLVQEKKIFELFFTLYGRGSHLGHVTIDFHFLVPESLHTKFG